MGSYFLVFTFSFVRFLPILTVGQTSGLGFIRLSQQVDMYLSDGVKTVQ
ncbi:hypothetical protein ISN44_As03g038670 [Arabidopsis suecica]|uniref:Transmembrane protein n=2 Tax=Arabidopsis TaxID=3701 RepID=A0A5S9XIM1_ARATH|nr:hypothetical protein ISN44_As03g038670 [Arabidopsis suecica]CAA0384806.1 unnamed protein product [Arabidopsis thaliana]